MSITTKMSGVGTVWCKAGTPAARSTFKGIQFKLRCQGGWFADIQTSELAAIDIIEGMDVYFEGECRSTKYTPKGGGEPRWFKFILANRVEIGMGLETIRKQKAIEEAKSLILQQQKLLKDLEG